MNKSLTITACVAGTSVLLLAGCGAPTASVSSATTTSASTSTSPSEVASESGTPTSDSSFINGVLTTPDMKIVIKRHKVIKPGQKGNEYGKKPVLAFWYSTTRLGDKDVDPSTAWIFTFNAFQDNNPNAENKLDIGTLPDDRYLDSQMETIKKGGTVDNAVSYELDDLKTPVDLVAGALFSGDDEIGRMTYQVS